MAMAARDIEDCCARHSPTPRSPSLIWRATGTIMPPKSLTKVSAARTGSQQQRAVYAALKGKMDGSTENCTRWR